MRSTSLAGTFFLTFVVAAAATAQRAERSMLAIPAVSAGEWFPADDYPPDAVRAGRSGRVVVDLGIDSAGKVVSCTVGQSSGTSSLDQKTCELALLRGHFNPATDKRGRPIASVFKLPVRWIVPDPASANVIDVTNAIHVTHEFEWVIGTDGLVESCRLLSGSLEGAIDQCKHWKPGVPWGARYESKGEAVRVIVRDGFARDARVAALPK